MLSLTDKETSEELVSPPKNDVWGAGVAVGMRMSVGKASSPGSAPNRVGVTVKVGVGCVGVMLGV